MPKNSHSGQKENPADGILSLDEVCGILYFQDREIYKPRRACIFIRQTEDAKEAADASDIAPVGIVNGCAFAAYIFRQNTCGFFRQITVKYYLF